MNGRTSASVTCKQVCSMCIRTSSAVQCIIISPAARRCANYIQHRSLRMYPLLPNTVYWLHKHNNDTFDRRGSLAAGPHSKKDLMARMFVSQRNFKSL